MWATLYCPLMHTAVMYIDRAAGADMHKVQYPLPTFRRACTNVDDVIPAASEVMMQTVQEQNST